MTELAFANMRTTCTALIVPARAHRNHRCLPRHPPGLVEGNIEAITRGDWHAYLNDEGKIINLPPSIRAGHFLRETGLYLANIFCGMSSYSARENTARKRTPRCT
ncbi:hypothetical protein [Arthrobacter sp. ISL-72]|uniref:hypothetical protein n=1 Tax=Arthrobacter sp. ISL-72 TaxID=2819114 RepID=UPI001BE6E66F|nr:hypothetical protein [Arthrobacter sp. ISL-72]